MLWHYTNTSGLLGIIQSNRLWASSAAMLNDATELTYGLGLAREVLDDLKVSAGSDLHPTQLQFLDDAWDRIVSSFNENDIFVVCASEEGDDLGQWRGYAEGSGYAIGFAAEHLVGIRPGQSPATWVRETALPGWRRVIYDCDEQRELLRRAWWFAAIQPAGPESTSDQPDWKLGLDAAESALAGVIAYLKHPGFVSERETRFVFDGRRFDDLLHFRSGPLGITPYIELAGSPEPKSVGHVTAQVPDKLPILGVRVGPAQDQDLAARGVRSLLTASGRPEVEVSVSSVPYR